MTRKKPKQPQHPSVNRLAAHLVAELLDQAYELRLNITQSACGATMVDAGIDCAGGLVAGQKIAAICMGGLGRVDIVPQTDPTLSKISLLAVAVSSPLPVLAGLGSQYAGWSLAHEGYFALGSGPARSLYGKEDILVEMGYRDQADHSVIVLESGTLPPDALVTKIAADCGIPPAKLTVIVTPTTSMAGSVQLAARVLEVALHKAHALAFPLADIVDGFASAPIPPPSSDFVTAMGRSNDAILYGGTVQLYVAGDAAAARDLAEKLPSTTSRDYGKGFAEIFAHYNHDFYQIDPMLFSPARVLVTALASGESFCRGEIAPDILATSFAVQLYNPCP